MLGMPKRVAEQTLFRQLIEAHTSKSADVRDTGALIHLAKRVGYHHDTRTMKFVDAILASFESD